MKCRCGRQLKRYSSMDKKCLTCSFEELYEAKTKCKLKITHENRAKALERIQKLRMSNESEKALVVAFRKRLKRLTYFKKKYVKIKKEKKKTPPASPLTPRLSGALSVRLLCLRVPTNFF